MNKARLEWVMSGLNQYALTQAEDQFLKTALEDFDKFRFLPRKAAPKRPSPVSLIGKPCFDVKKWRKQRFGQVGEITTEIQSPDYSQERKYHDKRR
jgi:hypothetical protein